MKKVLFTFILISIFAMGFGKARGQTVLQPGDIVIVAINGDADAPNYNRGFSFMPLVNLEAGTVINFTDYGWSDVAGSFITNTGIADAFIHYTAPTSITAGTIIRCDEYSHDNFTFDFTFSGTGTNPYLNTAGLSSSDELLVFQGARSSPVFICAVTFVTTGWAIGVGTDGVSSGSGSALPGSGVTAVAIADLVDDVTALSFNRAETSNDNSAYSGLTTAATKADWQARVQNYSNWTFNDIAPIPTPPVGPFVVLGISPTITSATYNATNGALVVTGTNIEVNGGLDIDATKFTITGQGGATRTLSTTNSVDRTSATEFTLTIAGADKTAVDVLLNKNGLTSVGGTTYNLAAADDWCTNFVGGADLTDNGITVSGLVAPTVTTQAISDITTTTSTGNGDVTATGGANVTERGVYYSTTNGFADGAGTKVSTTGDWSATGAFTQAITGLTANTTYYVKAFATNSAGTGYGTQVSFSTIACTNPTVGGTINGTQIICSGSLPPAFTSIILPSGHTGNLEYKWQKSTTSSTVGFADIAGSNSPTYTSEALTQTTWFKRIARVDCKSNWVGAAESNIITITVNSSPIEQTVSPESQAIISGNSATISIGSSEINTDYYLRQNSDNTVVDGPKSGTGSAIAFGTGNLSSTQTYNVYAEKSNSTTSGALNFDGANDYVSCGNADNLKVSTGTIEVWIKTTNAGSSYRAIVAKTFAYGLYLRNNTLIAYNWVNNSDLSTGEMLNDGNWHHIAFTFQNGVVNGSKFYIDGILKGTYTWSVNNQDSDFTIGDSPGYNQMFNGNIDEVRIWNTVRTQSEISANMNNLLDGNESGLVAYYSFENGTGTTLSDIAGGDNIGTLTNMDPMTDWTIRENTTICSLQMSATSTVTVNTLATVTTQDVSSISITTATGNGHIASLGSPNPTAYGVCWNTTGTPTTGDAKLDKGATSESGAFTASITGLTSNTLYYVRSFVTNAAGTVYGEAVEFRTLAVIPSAPTVNGATTNSLNVAVNANGNPAGTEFAIQESGTGNYVQLDDGALEATPDWQTAATWGTKTVTGLSANTQYTFQVKARNATPTETAFGGTTALYTLAAVPTAPTVNNATATTLDVSINVNSNPSGTEFAIQETGTGNYVQADGSNLAGGIVWHTAAIWDSPITVTGLTTGATYTFQVQARNGNNVVTAFGATTSGIPVAAPTVTTQASSAITATSATGNGTITATNGANATVRGAIIYPYTNTDLEIGGLNVINVAENGDFGTGAFTASLSSLSVNTQYNMRAYATSPNGTGYGSRVAFWTLANVPSAPTVTNPSTGTSLNVAINANGNPAATEFAIRTAGQYVQANGSLGAGEVWQTALTWGTIEVTSLTTGVEYTFDVKARNGNNVETGFGATATGTPVAHPTTQASGIEFSSITRNSITVRWINGNGDKRILLGRERYSIPSNPLTDGESYAANSNYTSATTVSGAKVLYNNTGTSVTVSGLTRYSLVYFKVMEYNEPTPGNTLYLQTDAAGNPRSRWTLRRDGMMEEDLTIDAEYAYPNPASYSISTTLDMFEAGTVSAKLYDAAGRVAAELYNQSLPFGTHELKFDISNVPSGVYQLIISKGNEAIIYPVSVVR